LIAWAVKRDTISLGNERSGDHVECCEDSESGNCKDQQKGS